MKAFDPKRGAFVIGILSFVLSVTAGAQRTTFPLLSDLSNLDAAVTPHQYGLILPALAAALDNNLGVGDGATIAGDGNAQPVSLGTLGTGYLFQGLGDCGLTGNCTVALVYPKPGGGFAAVVSGGGGLTLAGDGPVPEIYITWNESATAGTVKRMRFDGSKYVDDGSEGYDSGNPVSETGHQPFPLPDLQGQTHRPKSLSPNEYKQLRAPVLAALRTNMSEEAAAAAFEDAHGLENTRSAAVVLALLKAGDCDANGNCPIFAFQGTKVQHAQGMPTASGFSALAGPATGWSAVASTYLSRPSMLALPQDQVQLTLARRVSSSELTLEHFRQVPPDRFGAERLAMDVCADATGNIAPGIAFSPVGMEVRAAPCGQPPPPQRAIPVDNTRIGNLVADSTGALWATGVEIAPCGGELYRWIAGHWQLQTPPRPDVSLNTIRTGLNGGVVASWSSCFGTAARISVDTWLHGDQSTVQTQGMEPPQGAINTSMGVLVPVGGDKLTPAHTWAPGHEPGLARWSAGQVPARVFDYDNFPLRADGPGWQLPGDLHALQDASGQTWIWGSGFARGVLIIQGNAVTPHADLAGLPEVPVRTLVPWDATHIAAIMDDGGLYEIDTTSLQAAPVAPPQPNAFNAVQKVFSAGGDRYVESRRTRGPTGGAAGALTLWRLRGAEWQQLIADLGQTGCCRSDNTAWAYTSAGLWLSALPGGLWRIPDNGPAELVDWTHGLPLSGGISHLIAVDPDHLFATDGHGQSAEFDVHAVLTVKSPATDFSTPNIGGTLAHDSGGNVWALQADALAEWDGHSWKAHAFPAGIVRRRLTGVNVDSDGRVWLLPDCEMGPVAIYTPAQDVWSTVYLDYRNALRLQAEGRHFLQADEDLDPVSSPGGQMAFFGPCDGLNYFNGQRWQLWQPIQLLQDMPGAGVASQPGFDGAGNLVLNVYDHELHPVTWKWSGSAWQQASPQTLPPKPSFWDQAPAPPPGCSTTWPESLVFDAAGRAWWTAGGNLYVGVAGSCRILLPASQIQPFIDGRNIAAVMLDCCGNAFVSTSLPGDVVFTPGAGRIAEEVKSSK